VLTTTLSPVFSVSPRQFEIATLVADGLTDREIGQRLSISHRTVSNTLANVYEGIGKSSRAYLVQLLLTGRLQVKQAIQH
jgi:DNA-binding CsgD family transcriptional regulator